jgi:hypothetical protein
MKIVQLSGIGKAWLGEYWRQNGAVMHSIFEYGGNKSIFEYWHVL